MTLVRRSTGFVNGFSACHVASPTPSTGPPLRNCEMGDAPEDAMSVVLDSSMTLAWVYSEETSEAVSQVFALLGRSGAWVPQLWRLEVANVLEMGVRRK